MAAPSDPKKPPAGTVSRPSAPAVPAASTSGRTTSGELAMPAMPRYTGPEPKVVCGMARVPSPQDQGVEVVSHVTADAVTVPLGQGALPVLRGPVRLRLDTNLQPGEKPQLLPGAAAPFELELALTRFQDRAYAVARVGPGVPLGDSDESTATGLQKVAWKLPRPC